MLARYQERYPDFGPTLAAEKLALDGHVLDHETLRRWLLKAGLWQKRRKRGNIDAALQPSIGLLVAQGGRTTGFTTGTITSINTNVDVQYSKGLQFRQEVHLLYQSGNN